MLVVVGVVSFVGGVERGDKEERKREKRKEEKREEDEKKRDEKMKKEIGRTTFPRSIERRGRDGVHSPVTR